MDEDSQASNGMGAGEPGTADRGDGAPQAIVLPTFDIPDNVQVSHSGFIRNLTAALWEAVQLELMQRQLQVPEMKLLLTDDIMASADIEGSRIGIGPDRRSGVERLGCTVAGNALE